ncbi:MAG: PE-PPE domain-containing protein [Gordonia sp. (in: high G+C Gram-positive bacteria)]|uniref:cutinase family protein n=1 Tax=Gordonia sp. (in: high G+C Gram-positive bacteria) TaxID=84139 RepID=UPI0039E219A8
MGKGFTSRLTTVAIGMAATLVVGLAAPTAHAGPSSCGSGGAVIVAGTMAPRNAEGLPTGGVTGIATRYRARGYNVQYVDYPTHLWPLGETPYDEDVAIGKAATENAVAGYQRRCPGRPVVIAGYSQGARIAGDVLAEAGAGTNRRVSAAGLSGELYSDPRRDGPATGRGIENSLFSPLPGLTMSGPRPGGFGGVPVTQYCLRGDPICDLPALNLLGPITASDRLLGYFVKHDYYPARMSAPVSDHRTWECDPEVSGRTRDCVVDAAPSGVYAAGEAANPALVDRGLPGLKLTGRLLDQPLLDVAVGGSSLVDLSVVDVPLLNRPLLDAGVGGPSILDLSLGGLALLDLTPGGDRPLLGLTPPELGLPQERRPDAPAEPGPLRAPQVPTAPADLPPPTVPDIPAPLPAPPTTPNPPSPSMPTPIPPQPIVPVPAAPVPPVPAAPDPPQPTVSNPPLPTLPAPTLPSLPQLAVPQLAVPNLPLPEPTLPDPPALPLPHNPFPVPRSPGER